MTTRPHEISCYNTRFVEQRLADYLRDPKSVSDSWRNWFNDIDVAESSPVFVRSDRKRRSVFNPIGGNGTASRQHLDSARFQARVDQLVREYRVRGHLAAKLDPLDMPRPDPPELQLATHGLSEADLDRRCLAINSDGMQTQRLGDLVQRLRETYCRNIGVQFMHLDEPHVRGWLQQRMESGGNRIELSRDEQLRILTRLTDAVIFEEFVRKKYVGSKTFSLEGAESLIPLLDLAIEKAGRQGIETIVFGMAHRGRLNVLSNIIGKRPLDIFWEFNDPRPDLHRGRGDVKYHLGYSGDWTTAEGTNVHLSLCFNPSHLEFVNPVALGRTRAKSQRDQGLQGLTLLIHGDAAFAGEGVVQESLNLSQLDGYSTGGTLHVIVNNQLGFTTSPDEGRSTTYPSDIARAMQVPIFHVNGEYPEAVAQAVELALDFRAEFHSDVLIDMFCYRRWGHNEGDEPSFTQPRMYKAIEHRESVRDGYLEHLLELEGVARDEADEIAEQRHEELSRQFEQAKEEEYEPRRPWLTGVWENYEGGSEPGDDPETGVDAELLRELLLKLTETPDGFHVHKKLKRSVDRRRKMADGDKRLDWSTAEALAIATLAVAGHPVRMSGQDAERGTFSQRHAVLHDVVDASRYEIFQHLSDDQATVKVINSPLSEAGVLGFEYGYSMERPDALVAWESQYGDFANAAQVIIDQFLASAEDKWRRLSGLVLLLPHGFEGMGPEHSSARLERFLSLAAEDNLQVVAPTTPAQYFHLLRRQVLRRWRKPLIVMTPKSLLRHPQAVSALDDVSRGRFRRVLADDRAADVTRILLCSGKIYYELVKHREEHERNDIAIVRVEQLYPLREELLHEAMQDFGDETPVVWLQEEPENMGAWHYWRIRFGDGIGKHPLSVIARPHSASPATGSKASHKREQAELIKKAFTIDDNE